MPRIVSLVWIRRFHRQQENASELIQFSNNKREGYHAKKRLLWIHAHSAHQRIA